MYLCHSLKTYMTLKSGFTINEPKQRSMKTLLIGNWTSHDTITAKQVSAHQSLTGKIKMMSAKCFRSWTALCQLKDFNN